MASRENRQLIQAVKAIREFEAKLDKIDQRLVLLNSISNQLSMLNRKQVILEKDLFTVLEAMVEKISEIFEMNKQEFCDEAEGVVDAPVDSDPTPSALDHSSNLPEPEPIPELTEKAKALTLEDGENEASK